MLNILDMIKRVLSFQDWKEASTLPGWRARPSRMKKSRIPFHSSRVREIAEQTMHVEEFADKDARNARFRALRDKGTKHVSKYSTVRKNESGQWRSVWCVVRP